MHKPEKVLDSVRLNPHECEALLDALDKSSTKSQTSRRNTRRWKFRNRVIVAIKQAGAAQSYFVTPRNISTTGVAFLHGGYVHIGSPIAVAMRDLNEQLRTMQGRVVRCVHVQGRLHEIGVQFAEVINPKDFVPPGDEPAFNIERVEVERLHGRVLIVDDFRADQRLMAFHFRGSQLELTYAQDGASTVDSVDNSVDLVFLDVTLPDKPGIEVIAELRMKGYAGPVIAIIPSEDKDSRSRLLRAGANEVLCKPLNPDLLRQAAAEFLIAGGCEPESMSMLYSSITDPRMRELVEMYVNDCRRIGEEIADHIESGEVTRVRRAIEQLVGSAAAHGFDAIDRLARDAIKTIDLTQKIDESSAAIQAVVNACRRVAVRFPGEDDASNAA
jgi:CheY-like chemotaxis protein/HPt (histidine-containing phosphotransfer) domain-containing protein